MLIFDDAKGTSRFNWLKSTVAPGASDRARQLLRDYREVYPAAGWRELEARNRGAPRVRELLVGAMRDCGLPA